MYMLSPVDKNKVLNKYKGNILGHIMKEESIESSQLVRQGAQFSRKIKKGQCSIFLKEDRYISAQIDLERSWHAEGMATETTSCVMFSWLHSQMLIFHKAHKLQSNDSNTNKINLLECLLCSFLFLFTFPFSRILSLHISCLKTPISECLIFVYVDPGSLFYLSA